MTVPQEYQLAARDFERFLSDIRIAAGFGSSHPAYTTADAVLRVFKRRLNAEQSLRFAAVLPPLVRALFLEEPPAAPQSFADRESLTQEVLAVREHHNFAPPDAIAIVAAALRKQVNGARFDEVLRDMPAGAAAYWAQAICS